MKFDIFFSICQSEIEERKPSEAQMFRNFLEQVELADTLGFGTAWVAETHLSSEIQKQNKGAVIPYFKGEVGLNTDIFQLAHIVFSKTKKINVGSAICNILCNGGPIARAESVKTFLSLHKAAHPDNQRVLELGFASGRFPYINTAYGIHARNDMEKKAWPVLSRKVFAEAAEIFIRFVRGDIFNSSDVAMKTLQRDDFSSKKEWQEILQAYGKDVEKINIPSFWNFQQVGVIPFEAPLENLRLTVGTHEASIQKMVNTFWPCNVFNLSITSLEVIESVHERMQKHFHPKGGEWKRENMPRTALIFIDEDSVNAHKMAAVSNEIYLSAMSKTLDPDKVKKAVNNALVGNVEEVTQKIKERFHPEDRLMCWFDFNNHNSATVMKSMKLFMEEVAPNFQNL